MAKKKYNYPYNGKKSVVYSYLTTYSHDKDCWSVIELCNGKKTGWKDLALSEETALFKAKMREKRVKEMRSFEFKGCDPFNFAAHSHGFDVSVELKKRGLVSLA